MKRESVMLAQTWDRTIDVVGWLMSEKLDGHRAWWDGGVTRGMPCVDVPWANIDKDRKIVFATGLWSRNAKPIQAPGWFLDSLPQMALDGELYIGRGTVQRLASAIKKKVPVDSEWRAVRYHVFDTPPWEVITSTTGLGWGTRDKVVEPPLGNDPGISDRIVTVEQTLVRGLDDIEGRLCEVVAGGGEGLMLRRPGSAWTPIRSWDLLKVKKPLIGTGTVVGYNWAREGKLAGLMGCLRVEWSGKTFLVSGFTDLERECIGGTWAPGGIGDGRVIAFPIGSRISFVYREKTLDGAPKEGRYLR